jgi:hypothetical protein
MYCSCYLRFLCLIFGIRFVNIYLGAGGPGDVSLDRDDVDFLNANEYGILKPVDGFAASMGTKAAIDGFVSICEKMRAPAMVPTHVRNIDDPAGEVFCVYEKFKEWLVEDMNLAYPDAVDGTARRGPYRHCSAPHSRR